MIISPVSLCKAKILVFRTLSTCHFYCLRFSLFCFRLNSSIRNKTGTHVFWENGVDYPRVSPGAHPLAKKPEDSGYEIVYRAFSPDVTAAMLVFQNKEMAAMMVCQTNPPGIELYFSTNTFFCFSNPIWLLVT